MQCIPGKWKTAMLQGSHGFHYNARGIYTSINAAAFGYRAGLVVRLTGSTSGVTGLGLIGLRIGRKRAVGVIEAGPGVGGGGI